LLSLLNLDCSPLCQLFVLAGEDLLPWLLCPIQYLLLLLIALLKDFLCPHYPSQDVLHI
jgi:hypothetical protein